MLIIFPFFVFAERARRRYSLLLLPLRFLRGPDNWVGEEGAAEGATDPDVEAGASLVGAGIPAEEEEVEEEEPETVGASPGDPETPPEGPAPVPNGMILSIWRRSQSPLGDFAAIIHATFSFGEQYFVQSVSLGVIFQVVCYS